jgi:hypothetical protein
MPEFSIQSVAGGKLRLLMAAAHLEIQKKCMEFF